MLIETHANRFHVWAHKWLWYAIRGHVEPDGSVHDIAIFDELDGRRCPALEKAYHDVAVRLLREAAQRRLH